MNIRRITRIAPVLCASALVLAACGSDEGSPQEETTGAAASVATSPAESDNADGHCGDPSFPLMDANHDGEEPHFSVPVPEDWERNTMMDSEAIRLMAAVQGATEGEFASMVVTVEPSPVTGSDEVDRQLAGLDRLAAEGSITRHDESTTCGYTSQRIDYTVAMGEDAGNDATALIVSVDNPAGDGYTTAVLTIQSNEADTATYEKTRDAMIDGFQITNS
ncbi:hypothetical protein [Corynebacterium glyciniphilum]|uniref:hypothetical protein n=1 Tax=Corynebacterium glyciniphilum TaxID=1404244 RepID=UPI003FD29677